MATILDFLRDLLTEEDEQRMFLTEPEDYLEVHEFADLSGEDVAEAIAVLRRTLPADVAVRLEPYEGSTTELPPVRPLAGEEELDAAVRQLTYATLLARAGEPFPDLPAEEPAEGNAADETEFAPELEETEDTVTTTDTGYMTTEADYMAEPEAETSTADDAVQTGTQAYAALGEDLAVVVRDSTQKMNDLVSRAEGYHAQAILDAEATRVRAENEATGVREAASTQAEGILHAARTDADAMREAARSTLEEAERHASERLGAAEREATAMLIDAQARGEQVREAERQLHKRLAGVEAMVRSLQDGSTLSDDE